MKKRKDYLIIDKKSSYDFKITPLGREILEEGIEIREEGTQITHEQLKSGSWRNLHYRAYDIKAEHPDSFAGKLHPLQRTIEEIRRIFLNLGFTESRGTILESAFWNFDCLFQPQDHAAREMQDTFYIKTPRETLLPEDELVERVKKAHEDGGKTGSRGWKYQWDRDVARLEEELAQRLGTAVTIKPIGRKGGGKLVIVYRNLDQLDGLLAKLRR